MSGKHSETALVLAARQHFDNFPAPEDDSPDAISERDSLMYQYSIARESVAYFTKQRDKLLKQLQDSDEVASEIASTLEYVTRNDMGTEKMLESASLYNLFVKVSAPPQTFDKNLLHDALRDVFKADPHQVRDVMNKCTKLGTPRKTFTVHPKEHMG